LRRTRAAAAATQDDGTQNLASLEDHIRFDHVDELAVELANEAIRSKINEILQDGTFALIHLAAQGGKIEAMRVLIDAGADLNLHSANGQMPLDLAYQCNQQ
jgi:ankyrin repeat protein